MGSDPAPFLVNLFFYYYEDKWISKRKRKDLITARKCVNTFRFKDALRAINDGREFGKALYEIYPPTPE